MDDTYQAYVNRVARMTLPEAYQSQIQHIQPSPKYQQPDATPVPFPGYTVLNPPWAEDEQNAPFYQHLAEYQQQIVDRLDPGIIIPVPPSSFHMTLADLIWDSAYLHAAESPSFEADLQTQVAQSLQKCQSVQSEPPIYWQVIGLFLRTRAVGVCLVPREESSYERVLQIRRAIYQNPGLIALGIEQQYNYTAHVTLGYFGEAVATADRQRISHAMIDLTQHWIGSPLQEIWIHRAELRKFDDMTRYYREPDWAALDL